MPVKNRTAAKKPRTNGSPVTPPHAARNNSRTGNGSNGNAHGNANRATVAPDASPAKESIVPEVWRERLSTREARAQEALAMARDADKLHQRFDLLFEATPEGDDDDILADRVRETVRPAAGALWDLAKSYLSRADSQFDPEVAAEPRGGTAPGKSLSQKSDEVNTKKEVATVAGVLAPASGSPAAAPSKATAVDADGRKFEVGQLIENLSNHDDWGRVESVHESIVLYRQLGSPDCRERGELCTWQNDELRIVEDAPPAPPADLQALDLTPAAAAALGIATQLARIQNALCLAEGVATGGDELVAAQEKISAAIDEVMSLVRSAIGDYPTADAALANALEAA